MTPCEKQFYTYLYLRYDGTPSYVGKGSGKRAFERQGHIVKPPRDRRFIIIQEHESEATAFAAEIFLIAYYGRIDLGTGCLRNRTDGGDQPPSRKGCKQPPEAVQRSADANRGRKHTEATRNRISESLRGFKPSEETRRKLSAAQIGKHSGPKSAEHRLNFSKARKGKPWSAARRAAQERLAARNHTWQISKGITRSNVSAS